MPKHVISVFQCRVWQTMDNVNASSTSVIETGIVCDTYWIACLHDQNKSGFFGGPAFSANQSFLKTFLIALVG